MRFSGPDSRTVREGLLFSGAWFLFFGIGIEIRGFSKLIRFAWCMIVEHLRTPFQQVCFLQAIPTFGKDPKIRSRFLDLPKVVENIKLPHLCCNPKPQTLKSKTLNPPPSRPAESRLQSDPRGGLTT